MARTMWNEFDQLARDCMRVAIETNDENVREEMIDMARRWIDLAIEEDTLYGAPPSVVPD
jgi:hypothetical protein